MSLSNDERYAAHRGGLASGAALRAYDQSAITPLGENTQLRCSSMLQLATSFPTIAGTAYFLYIGQVARTIKLNKVYFVTSAVGAGALTQEFGIATTPNAPDGTIQPLTIRAIDTTATDYTGSVGRYSNGGNLAHTPPVGSHIWVFARFQPATTQPGIANGLACDIGQFSVFTFASVGTPLVLGQVIPTPASVSVTLTTAVAPNLILSV